MPAMPLDPSGAADFDRARELLADGRDEEALDWFEVATSTADDPAVRASACAHAAAVLLSLGRPWEVDAWATMLRSEGGDEDLARLLEGSARLQLEDVEGALATLDGVAEPHDPWFPCSPTAVRVVRAHARYLLGDTEQATDEVLACFADDAAGADVWDALARLCADTDFDPAPVVAALPAERTIDVLAALVRSEATGVDRIVECMWERMPGDPRLLALVPSFAARLESRRALEWSARMRAAGMGRVCPLLARADDVRVDAAERARAATLAYATFGDRRGRESLELACAAVADDDLDAVLAETWELAPALADSVVVAAATSARRALIVAAGLHRGGAADEAYAVLVHGLAMESAEALTTEDVVALLPVGTIEALAETAEKRGEDDVAGLLEAVAVVAATDH